MNLSKMNFGKKLMGRMALLVALVGVGLGAASLQQARPAAAFDDGSGREWRQLYETTYLSWDAVATVCPQDGVTACTGAVGGKDLTGWVWATADQVGALMAPYGTGFGGGVGFLDVMRWTGYQSTTYSYAEWTYGWTSSKDADGYPIGGGASYGYWPPAGGVGLGPVASTTEVNQYRGVFLWRDANADWTPPIITPTITGTLGNNGWYRSNVGLTWSVVDAESAIVSQTGCEPATVNADTAGVSFTCQAASQKASASATVTIKRDATAPGMTCATPAPVFQLGQQLALVSANVTDAMSGPAATTVSAAANTTAGGSFAVAMTGSDLAGNTASKSCGYQVVVPTCRGFVPTILGTANGETINGTAGRDIILALGGNDTINGLGGDDVICAGDGYDTVDGGLGNDLIDGGDGNDTLNGGDGDDTIDGGLGNDAIDGEGGKDRCTSGEIRMSSCNAY